MNFFHTVSVKEAKVMLCDLGRYPNLQLQVEEVALSRSAGRILARDLVGQEDIPAFDRSNVDGYVIRASDSYGASESLPSFLEVAGEVKMGCLANVSCQVGQAVYVPTGGMLPADADAVVMIEYVEKMGDMIAVHRPCAPGENITYRGDDLGQGQVLLQKGTKMGFDHIGLLASAGFAKVPVYKPFRACVLSTGDEIVDVDKPFEMGKIRDANGYAIAALVEKLGGVVVTHDIIRDDKDLLRGAIAKGLADADIVFMSGGSSVGEKDYTLELVNSFEGEGAFVHGIAIKPGKPTVFASCEGKPVIGLPGHPMSAVIVFTVFVTELMNTWMGIEERPKPIPAKMETNMHSFPGRETYQMVTLDWVEEERAYRARPIFGKSSLTGVLSRADGYIVMGQDDEGLNRDEIVLVHTF